MFFFDQLSGISMSDDCVLGLGPIIGTTTLVERIHGGDRDGARQSRLISS